MKSFSLDNIDFTEYSFKELETVFDLNEWDITE